MTNVRAPNCPTCGDEWAVQRDVERIFLLEDKEAQHENVVLCAQGHEFAVVRWEPPCVAVIVRPEVVKGTRLTVRATNEACVCGGSIQPGQAYLSDPVRHVGCGP